MLLRENKLALAQDIAMVIARNRSKKPVFYDELLKNGLTQTEIDDIPNRGVLINFSDNKLMMIANVCDKIFNTSLFKQYDDLHRNWNDISIDEVLDNFSSQCLVISNCYNLYQNYYMGSTSIGELLFSMSCNDSIIDTPIPFDKISNTKSFTRITEKEIVPIIIYYNDINFNFDNNTLQIYSGAILEDSLYFALFLYNKLKDSNTQIQIYTVPNKHSHKRTETIKTFYENINNTVKNDIINYLQYDVFTEIKINTDIDKSIIQLILSNTDLDYSTKIKRVAKCLDSIKSDNMPTGVSLKSKINEVLRYDK